MSFVKPVGSVLEDDFAGWFFLKMARL